MKRLCAMARVAACLTLGLTACALRAEGTPDFTPDEKQWIKDHPVVRFATEPWFPPIDTIENGRHAGIVDQYLLAVTRQSGLKFDYVPTDNWIDAQHEFLEKHIDLLPDVAIGRLDTATAHQVLFTDSYYATPTVIATQGDRLVTLDPRSLNGKSIATSSAYASTLIRRFPSATLIEVKDTEKALELVDGGQADAAVGPEVVIGPLIRRKYTGRIGMSGYLDDLPFLAHMGVHRDDRLLYSILQKSLGNLSAAETDTMVESALDRTDYGKPSLLSIIRYRASELGVLSVFIALILLFAYRTRLARRAAERSEMAKSRFLAVMSHEIRTPMNAVLGSIEMLQRTAMDDRQNALTRTASGAAESLLSLLDDVLDLSKLDAKRLTLEFIATDLSALVHKIVEIIDERARAKGLRIEVSIDCPADRDALIDPTRFRQVLVNLLTNALKFTDHGHIRIELKIDNDASAGEPASVAVRVADTGIGISAKDQVGLFNAYTQADSSTTRRYGGSGLGLTISKDLVELMGGHITLDSVAGAGTQVGFTLPVKMVDRLAETEPARIVGPAEPAMTLASGMNLSILLVDDHVINQFVIGEQLRELGVHPVIVSDGKSCLEAIAQQSFGLVLMDCHMPEMDGYEVTRRIREGELTEHSGHLPIIALSAATDASHLRLCMSSGMDGVLKKPLRLDELRGMLEMWVGALPTSLERIPQSTLESDENFSYKEALAADVDALTRALDGDAVGQLAHRLKGAAHVAQFMTVGKLAEQLEVLVQAHETTYYADALALLAKLRSEVLLLGDATVDAGQPD